MPSKGFHKILDTGVPEFNLVAYFWQNIRNDLLGRGCLELEVTPAFRGLTYEERAKMERQSLQQDALAFLDSPDFVNWADLSGANPESLREELLNEYAINS